MPPAQQYDPNNPTPYQAPDLPQITPPPTPQTAQEPAQLQRGPMTNLGGIAEVLNSGLKGYMQGKADKTLKDYYNFKKQDDNYKSAYNMAAQNLKTLHDSGTDPNSDQYKQAVSAVQGTWQGLMTFRGQHMGIGDPGMSGKKKKSKDSQGGGDPNNPIAMLSSNDPQQKLQGAYAMMARLGPPVLMQLGDPKIAAQRKQTAELSAGNELSEQQRQKEVNDLAAIPASQRTPEQQARYTELTTKPIQPQPGDEALKAKDAIYTKVEKGDKLTEDERRVIGLDPKSRLEVTKTGEIVALNGDGTFEIKRGAQPDYMPPAKTTKIPKAVEDRIISQKNDAITAARTLFLHGDPDSTDPKKQKIDFDEYVDRWQQAQDKYEERIETLTGQPVEHVDVKSNVDDKGNWKGPKTSEAQGGETGGIPNNLRGQKPAAGVSGGGANNPEELPDEIAKQLKPGFISNLSDGSRWTMKNGKPFQVSAGTQ